MASSGATRSGTPDSNTVFAAAAFDLMFHSGCGVEPGWPPRRTAPPISAIRLIFLPIPGDDVSSAATLVSSPTATMVSSPGRASICWRRKATPPSVRSAGEVNPAAHSACFRYCDAVDVPATTGIRAAAPPSTASSFAASLALATASPETVVTPSTSSSGLRRSNASA